MANRLREYYDNTVFNGLKDKFEYKNVMEVPKLEKITINMGLGDIKDNQKMLETAVQAQSRYAYRCESNSQRRKYVYFR